MDEHSSSAWAIVYFCFFVVDLFYILSSYFLNFCELYDAVWFSFQKKRVRLISAKTFDRWNKFHLNISSPAGYQSVRQIQFKNMKIEYNQKNWLSKCHRLWNGLSLMNINRKLWHKFQLIWQNKMKPTIRIDGQPIIKWKPNNANEMNGRKRTRTLSIVWHFGCIHTIHFLLNFQCRLCITNGIGIKRATRKTERPCVLLISFLFAANNNTSTGFMGCRVHWNGPHIANAVKRSVKQQLQLCLEWKWKKRKCEPRVI